MKRLYAILQEPDCGDRPTVLDDSGEKAIIDRCGHRSERRECK